MKPPTTALRGANHGIVKGDIEAGKPLLTADSGDKYDTATRTRSATMFGVPTVLVSGLAYALSSCCLTLLNKHALAGFGFSAPNALLLFQCALTVLLVKACEVLRLINPLQPLRWRLIAVW
jgi:hypothetical protein